MDATKGPAAAELPPWIVNWSVALGEMGVPETYYHIDTWLQSEDVDSEIVERFENVVAAEDPFLMWRCLLVADISEWDAHTTMQTVSNQIDLRCFVRMQSLRAATPTAESLKDFVNRNTTAANWALRYVAGLWTNARALDPEAPIPTDRERWLQLLDDWGDRVARTQDYLRPFSLNRT